MSELELTRELLMDAGGFVEMKKARAIHRDGAVKSAEYVDGVLSGEVRVGGKVRRVRMEIFSKTHMENHCTCLMVRQDGRVCAHAMALGLEVIEPLGGGVEAVRSVIEVVEDRWPKVSDEGVGCELSVMLPLKVENSWEKGQLMVGFGAKVGGEEILLSALRVGEVSLDEFDEGLWQVLRDFFPGEAPGVVNFEREGFERLLEGLVGHPRVWFGKKERAEVAGGGLRREIRVVGDRLKVEPGNLRKWHLDGGHFFPLALGLPDREVGIFGQGLRVSAGEARGRLGKLERWFEVPESVWASLPEEGEPEVVVYLEGSLRHLEARLEFWYEGVKGVSDGGEAQLVNGVLTNVAAEAAVVDFFRGWGFEGPASGGRMVLREREEILRFHGFAELPSDWRVERGARFGAVAKQVVAVRPEWEFRSSGEEWFEVETRFRVGGEELPAEQIERMLRMGSGEQAYGRGKIAVIDAGFLEEVQESLGDAEGRQTAAGVFRVRPEQAEFLRMSARDFGMMVEERDEMAELDLPDFLRDYQKAGVRWMWRLSEMGLGGILADDMGLGKTLQTLMFLKMRGGRGLVVCPSSLVSNWAVEAAKWVPELSVAVHVGGKRGGVPEGDLVITSYAILRVDEAKFRAENFGVIVLDEAQQIKNPESQIAKVVHGLRAKDRFALSGTPVENSLQDLWSVMQFVLPGYLGPRKVFMDRFEKPLRTGGDAAALGRRLARRLKPVVLRRMKSEVAKDLPERIEQVRYCELSGKQQGIYRQLLDRSRAEVEAAGDGKRRMVALTALLRLRQACCDLRLLPGLKVGDDEAGIKLEVLEDLLAEAVAGGHRVLVFSQFVQLLQGVVPMLAGRGWEFCYLDGATRRRGEVVERFQDGKAPVFLISLKAGGVGLNLTAADTVIHLDPWWNPAVEAQATDRAHRIGQKRVVTSYKLITRGTVEEKILALQEKKKAMFDSVFENGSGLVPGLEESELMSFFEG